ncbi:hypothetical protein Tco_0078278 [Tanacetum coccineum]
MAPMALSNSEVEKLKSELEKVKQEKEGIQFKIAKFDNASKSLDNMLVCTLTIDLSSSGLEEFQQPDFEGYGPKISKSVNVDTSNEVRKSHDTLLIEKLVSDDKSEKKTIFPTVAKIEFVRPKQQEKPVRKTLGNDFVMHNKACYVCGSFDHLQYTCEQKRQLNGQMEGKPVWNNAKRVNHQNSPRITHPNPKRNMVPRKVLTRSGTISLNTARQSHLNAVCYSCSRQVNTARPKAVINAVRTNQVNDVKESACWVWRPIKSNSASITLKRYDYVDARGRSRLSYKAAVKLHDQFGDEKRAGAELTQQNDKSQYKK